MSAATPPPVVVEIESEPENEFTPVNDTGRGEEIGEEEEEEGGHHYTHNGRNGYSLVETGGGASTEKRAAADTHHHHHHHHRSSSLLTQPTRGLDDDPSTTVESPSPLWLYATLCMCICVGLLIGMSLAVEPSITFLQTVAAAAYEIFIAIVSLEESPAPLVEPPPVCFRPLFIPRLYSSGVPEMLPADYEQMRVCNTSVNSFPVHPDSFFASLHSPAPQECQPQSKPMNRLSLNEAFWSELGSHGYTEDPLPECTMLDPRVTLNLLNYARYIQVPHLHADCSQYSNTKTCLGNVSSLLSPVTNITRTVNRPSDAPLTPKWLVFWMYESGGGHADRLKGLFSIFSLALITQRAFSIHNVDPLPWESFFLPNVLPWIPYSQLDAALKHPGLDGEVYNWMNGPKMIEETAKNLPQEWDGKPVVLIRDNFNTMAMSAQQEFLYPYWANMSLDRTAAGDLDLYLGCFHQFLFRPSPLLAEAMNTALTKVERPLVSSSQPTQAYHAIWDYYTSTDPSITQKHIGLYCAQLRMGLSGTNMGFQDVAGFINSGQLPDFLRDLKNRISQIRQHSTLKVNVKVNVSVTDTDKYYLFVTSDSAESHALLPGIFPAPPADYVLLPGNPIHLNKVPDHMRADRNLVTQGYLHTLLSFHLLGECDITHISRSGFGALSQWRTRTLRQMRRLLVEHDQTIWEKPYKYIYQIDHNAKTVFEYIHIRGSGGTEQDTDVDYIHRRGSGKQDVDVTRPPFEQGIETCPLNRSAWT